MLNIPIECPEWPYSEVHESIVSAPPRRKANKPMFAVSDFESVDRAFAYEKTVEVALKFFEALDSAVSLSCYMLLNSGELNQLINKEVDPLSYSNAFSFANDYQAVSFLSKFKDFDLGFDRTEVAREKFRKAELICVESNRRLRGIRDGSLKVNPDFNSILRGASRKISKILGDVDLDAISHRFGWGPGSTTSVGGRLTSAYNKFEGPLDVTSSALVYGLCCVNSIPSWANSVVKTQETPSLPVSVLPSAFNIVKGDEIVFVLKNAKTDRTIGIPAHVDSYLQKGFGSYIRQRLRRVGVDLNDQSINQRLAFEGSKTGLSCTMDLSMASDTICIEIVRDLLPEEWFQHLYALRAPQGTFRDTGEVINYAKFSSMGNGFTFELESLIFYAICKTCVEHLGLDGVVSVYGDDLIFPSEAANFITEMINLCGFSVNVKKSFAQGPFRESCGADFFLGTNVRPIFLKESLSNVEGLYKLANSIRRLSHSGGSYHFCDRRFRSVWSAVVSCIPRRSRYLIPEGFGDVGLISNFDEATPALARLAKDCEGWEGFFFYGATRHAVKREMTADSTSYVTHLSAIGSEEPLLGQFALRRTTFLKRTRILVREWKNLGPWE